MVDIKTEIRNKSERRRYPRYRLLGRFPGVMEYAHQEFTVLPVDVSKAGLGVVSEVSFVVNGTVLLRLQRPEILELEFRICWQQSYRSELGGGELYRAGFELLNANKDLIELLSRCDEMQMQELG